MTIAKRNYDSQKNTLFKNLKMSKFDDICKLQTEQFMYLNTGRLHEPGLGGQVASPGQPFSTQTPVAVYM